VTDLDEEIRDDLAISSMDLKSVPVQFQSSAAFRCRETEIVEREDWQSGRRNVTCRNVAVAGCTPGAGTRTVMSGENVCHGLKVNVLYGTQKYCPCNSLYHKIELTFSESDLFRWQRVARILEKREPVAEETLPPSHSLGGICQEKRAYFLSRALNFDLSIEDVLDVLLVLKKGPSVVFSWISLAILVTLTTAYGGIHMSVWHYEFPTEKERWLWRASSIAVAAFGWFLSIFLFLIIDENIGMDEDTAGVVLILVIFVVTLLCAAARVFIVVESFLSLRAVPIGVYATLAWTNYIPHI
jgi:hypothetical protein